MNPFRTLTRAAWIALAIAAVALMVLIWWLFTNGQRERVRAENARAVQVVAEGQIAAGRDAVAIVAGNAARDDQIDRQTKENADAIRNAPGADQPLDPGLDAAARRAVCMRASARRDPQCIALLNARPD